MSTDAGGAGGGWIRARILLITLTLVIAAAALLSFRTNRLFEAALEPQLTLKTEMVAEFTAMDITWALSRGIPLDRLVGVPDYLAQKRAGNPEILYVALMDSQGRTLHVSGAQPVKGGPVEQAARELAAAGGQNIAHVDIAEFQAVLSPVRLNGTTVAAVAIRLDPTFVRAQLQALAQDVFVILLVALFLVYEVAIALSGKAGPLGQLVAAMGTGRFGHRITHFHRDEIGRAIRSFNATVLALNARYRRLAEKAERSGSATLRDRVKDLRERFGFVATPPAAFDIPPSVTDMRLPLFVFVIAEELQKAFLPLYISELESQIPSAPGDLLIGLPISIYMLALALATPLAGSWTDRYGPRRIFLTGVGLAILGFLWSALAATLVGLIGARAITAVGYAMCTIAAQGFIVQTTSSADRTQGISVFVTVLMSASICGTSIGGILADQLDYRIVFVCAAALALLAGLLAWRMMGHLAPLAAERRGFRLADLGVVLRNPRFVALVLFAAIPNKIVLTGFLFYAVPLYLAELGASEAETGRVMILYSLVIVVAGPWLSRMADRHGYIHSFVFVGTFVSGAAMGLLWFWPDIYGVALAVVAVAFAHAISISPQVAMVPQICRAEIEAVGQTTLLGELRMLERIGSVIGPLLIAAFSYQYGFVTGLIIMGGMIALLSPLLLLSKREARA
ncbi:MFS transporter [Aquabacter sp. CN5-332]|uniref:MFS transporter n=1 Tax=Aquabacter sp. CN5-332 TaxID=3156608 RepID=UPI0032B41676